MDNAMFVDKFTLSTLTQSKFVNKHSQFIQLQKTLGIKKNDGNDDVDDNGVPMAKFWLQCGYKITMVIKTRQPGQ